jgi:hypothetical protein
MRVRGIVVLEYGKAGDYVRWYSAHWYKSKEGNVDLKYRKEVVERE